MLRIASFLSERDHFDGTPREDMESTGIFNDENYLKLLDLVHLLVRSLEAKREQYPMSADCQQLAKKLLFHSATLWNLHLGMSFAVPVESTEGLYYDFASGAVLTRAALEAFLIMFEVFFAPGNEDVCKYRYWLWKLSGLVIRENTTPSDPEEKSNYEDSRMQIRYLREQIQQTETFANLKPPQKHRILKGNRLNKEFKSRLRDAGFKLDAIFRIYRFYSGYAHSDALSGAQVEASVTTEDQIEQLKLQMGIVMMVLSRTITEYVKLFPEAKGVAANNKSAHGLSNVLTLLVSLEA